MDEQDKFWAVGYNFAGCMPEGHVAVFDDYLDAVTALMEEMKWYASEDDDAAFDQGLVEDGDEQPAMLATVQAIMRDEIVCNPLSASDRELAFSVEDWSGRRVEFWLHESAELVSE